MRTTTLRKLPEEIRPRLLGWTVPDGTPVIDLTVDPQPGATPPDVKTLPPRDLLLGAMEAR